MIMPSRRLLLLVALAAASPVMAQGRTAGSDTSGTHAFRFRYRFAFEPGAVIEKTLAIDLSDGQRRTVATSVRRAAATTRTLQQDLDTCRRQFDALLQEVPVNPPAVLAAFERVLAAEDEIKRVQMRLMLESYGQLTPSQQRQVLRSLAADPD